MVQCYANARAPLLPTSSPRIFSFFITGGKGLLFYLFIPPKAGRKLNFIYIFTPAHPNLKDNKIGRYFKLVRFHHSFILIKYRVYKFLNLLKVEISADKIKRIMYYVTVNRLKYFYPERLLAKTFLINQFLL